MSNETLLRSSPGANLNDDAVFTQVGATTNDPWFYDPNQGLGVEDVELSRDLQTVVGIAGFNSEKLRVYRTTMSPFGAPDWDHTPFTNHENVPVAQQCYELPGTKFDNTTLAPSGAAMAYSTAAGVYVASIPAGCAPGDAGALVLPGAKHPDWGVADVPPASAFETPAPVQPPARPGAASKLVLSVTRAGKVTVTVPGAGKVTVTAKRKSRTVAKVSQDGEGRRQGHVQAQAARQGDRHGEAGRVDREAGRSQCVHDTGFNGRAGHRREQRHRRGDGSRPGGPGREGRARRPPQGPARRARRRDRRPRDRGRHHRPRAGDRRRRATVSELGRLDIVVNNAGVMLLGDIVDAPVEEWERMIDLNLKGLLYVAHAALPHLLKFAQEGPREVADLVNISSVAGRRVGQGGGIYQLTKHGVGVFAEALRQEVTARHVRSSLVEPGATESELVTHVREEVRGNLNPSTYKILEAADIADAVVYIVTRPRHMAVNEILIRPTEQVR